MDTAWNDSVRESKMQNLLWNLGNAMGNMSAAGLADKAYIYAYDETPESNTSVHTIREMLGAVKQKYPALRTMATLNWPSIVPGFPGVAGGIPSDFPLDVWVNEYAQWGQADHYRTATPKKIARQEWLSASPDHKFWWYWW